MCVGAQYLVKQGLADAETIGHRWGFGGRLHDAGRLGFPRRLYRWLLFIHGAGDLAALARRDTHKFESRYLDGLVGKYPEDEKIYVERAPIHSVDKLNCPILLLQGDEDKIVPPNHLRAARARGRCRDHAHKALLEKKVPAALKIYEGEQHGFRKSENIEDALNSELYFFSRCWLRLSEGQSHEIEVFPIDNYSVGLVLRQGRGDGVSRRCRRIALCRYAIAATGGRWHLFLRRHAESTPSRSPEAAARTPRGS